MAIKGFEKVECAACGCNEFYFKDRGYGWLWLVLGVITTFLPIALIGLIGMKDQVKHCNGCGSKKLKVVKPRTEVNFDRARVVNSNVNAMKTLDVIRSWKFMTESQKKQCLKHHDNKTRFYAKRQLGFNRNDVNDVYSDIRLYAYDRFGYTEKALTDSSWIIKISAYIEKMKGNI